MKRSYGLRVLTNSRLKAYRRCKRLHHLRYELGMRPAQESEDLRFGSLMHRLLEVWWAWLFEAEADTTEVMGRAFGGFALDDELCNCGLGSALYLLRCLERDLFVQAKAEALLVAYDAKWLGARLRPIAIEKELYAPLVNPISGLESRTWLLGGKLDVLAIDLDYGDTVIIDHKTSSEDLLPGSRFWKRLRMDGQPSQYFELAEGYAPARFIYDVIKKPKHEPAKATPEEERKYTQPTKKDPISRLYKSQREFDETPDEYGQRIQAAIAENPDGWLVRDEIVRLASDMAAHRADVWAEAKIIRGTEIDGRNPRNPDACEAIGMGTCEFFDLCVGDAQADDRSRFIIADNPHAELNHIPNQPQEGQENEQTVE